MFNEIVIYQSTLVKMEAALERAGIEFIPKFFTGDRVRVQYLEKYDEQVSQILHNAAYGNTEYTVSTNIIAAPAMGETRFHVVLGVLNESTGVKHYQIIPESFRNSTDAEASAKTQGADLLRDLEWEPLGPDWIQL